MLRVRQAFGCILSKPACQHSQRSPGLISHFPALWQSCGAAQLFVALLILPTLLLSLLLSPSPCARLLVGELGEQQGPRLQPPFWAEIRGFVVFWTVNRAGTALHSTGGLGKGSSHRHTGRDSLQCQIHPISELGELEGPAQLTLSWV